MELFILFEGPFPRTAFTDALHVELIDESSSSHIYLNSSNHQVTFGAFFQVLVDAMETESVRAGVQTTRINHKLAAHLAVQVA